MYARMNQFGNYMRQGEGHSDDELVRELSRLQEQIRNLMGSLPIGIAIIDARGIIEGVNPAIGSLFDYEGRELVGRDIATLLRNAPWLGGTVKDWYLANSNHVVELEGLSKDGDVVLIELTVNSLDADVIERLIVTVQDVAERFLANKLKQEIFRMINHDIRAPLANVALFLELLESEEVVTALPKVGKSRILAAKMNVQRVLNLASGLLELDQLESGMSNLQRRPVSIRKLIESCVTGMAQAAGAKAIEIDADVEEAVIKGDFARLEQVIFNLLSNAVAHSPSGKPIELKAKAQSCSIKVSVRDNGAGVPNSEKATIFEKYMQGALKTTEGYGLGLAICKEIIRQHGGEIGCEDAPGGGSIFWFELPASETSCS
jgi:PAS domain S-box-containing protein